MTYELPIKPFSMVVTSGLWQGTAECLVRDHEYDAPPSEDEAKPQQVESFLRRASARTPHAKPITLGRTRRSRRWGVPLRDWGDPRFAVKPGYVNYIHAVVGRGGDWLFYEGRGTPMLVYRKNGRAAAYVAAHLGEEGSL